MRRFTKKHNKLSWLYPQTTEYHTAEQLFDTMEQRGKELLKKCYGDKQTFSADEMIDAFMKGSSEMNRTIGWDSQSEKQLHDILAKLK